MMITNHRMVRILPISDKIIAYLHNQSNKKIVYKKFPFVQLLAAKKVQNLMILGEMTAYLRN